jgi:hypothetical protein
MTFARACELKGSVYRHVSLPNVERMTLEVKPVEGSKSEFGLVITDGRDVIWLTSSTAERKHVVHAMRAVFWPSRQ